MDAIRTSPAAFADIPPAIAARLPGFADLGIDFDQLVAAVRAAGPERGPATPGWPEAMMAHGHAAMAAGEAAELRHDSAAAEAAFMAASFWYFFARFPHILNAGGAEAYRLHRAAYRRAAAHFRDAVEEVRIPFAAGAIPALLRLPRGAAGPVPLVLLAGGTDVWKTDLEVHSMAQACLRHGMATLALDVPGTGECPVALSPAGIDVFLAALRHARADARIDAGRIGAYAISFGGYYAMQLAVREPSLAGIVQVGAPVHHAFQPENVAILPPYVQVAFARMFGCDPAVMPADLPDRIAALSLRALGVLPAAVHAPMLAINGDADEMVPVAEFAYLVAHGVHPDTLLFAGDRHVASRNWHLQEGFATAWLARRLGAGAVGVGTGVG
jgi:esterase FrsA